MHDLVISRSHWVIGGLAEYLDHEGAKMNGEVYQKGTL